MKVSVSFVEFDGGDVEVVRENWGVVEFDDLAEPVSAEARARLKAALNCGFFDLDGWADGVAEFGVSPWSAEKRARLLAELETGREVLDFDDEGTSVCSDVAFALRKVC